MYIYIVDDNPDICDFLAFLLSHEGYRVHSFADPEAALMHIQLKQTQLKQTQLKQAQPTILITDYNLPKFNGYELHKQVCLLVPDVKTIIISGRNVSNLIGRLHFLQKPFQPEHMVTLVKAICPANYSESGSESGSESAPSVRQRISQP